MRRCLYLHTYIIHVPSHCITLHCITFITFLLHTYITIPLAFLFPFPLPFPSPSPLPFPPPLSVSLPIASPLTTLHYTTSHCTALIRLPCLSYCCTLHTCIYLHLPTFLHIICVDILPLADCNRATLQWKHIPTASRAEAFRGSNTQPGNAPSPLVPAHYYRRGYVPSCDPHQF